MAGPTASVIVRVLLSTEQLAQIAGFIRSKADKIDGNDFWIRERPFFWTTGEEYPGELSNDDFHNFIGWQPADQVILVAMCNSNEDHRVLAELCIEIARMLNGLIDFGGSLGEFAGSTVGQFWEYEYGSVSGVSVAHLGTHEFLGWWLQQPDFRMVK